MSTILDYFEYSKLATAAYTLLDGVQLQGNIIAFIADGKELLPLPLARQTFEAESKEANHASVWTIPQGGYYGNDAEGFAAILFSRKNTNGLTEKVLAIRGTEPDRNLYQDLLKSDIAHIGLLGFALGQAVSLINYVSRLQASTSDTVKQFSWEIMLNKPTGLPSIALPEGKGYIYLSEIKAESGLGLINPGEKIVLTGHSLGGHLAALGSRLFPDLISDSYTYNAPGFDPITAEVVLDVVAALYPSFGKLKNIIGTVSFQLTDEFVSLVGDTLGKTTSSIFSNTTLHTLESDDIANGDDIDIIPSILTGDQSAGQEIFVSTEKNSHMMQPIVDKFSCKINVILKANFWNYPA